MREISEQNRAIMELTRFIQADMRDIQEIWRTTGFSEKEWIRFYLDEVHLSSPGVQMKRTAPGLWRAYLLMVALDLRSVNRLARTLARRPDLLEMCGLRKPPSQPSLSRFCRRLGENVADVEAGFRSITSMENWRTMPDGLRDRHRALDGIITIMDACWDNLWEGRPADRRLGPKMKELRLRARVRSRAEGTEPDDPDSMERVQELAVSAERLLEKGLYLPDHQSDELDARLEAVGRRLFGK